MHSKKREKFICREDYPVVQTTAGKVRGYVWNDMVIFKGIPYARARRFQKPESPEHWEGVRNVQSYGMVCPLLSKERPNGELFAPHMYWPEDENCQYLNIWTPSLDYAEKLPVMVWLHGGGFFGGSSMEQLAYEGSELSRFGNVVVVSVNHRLNILGYLNLSCLGNIFEDSANAGTLDLAAALVWIQENIRAFGGNPDNVTLFGQSGGGMKVGCLMQMPGAKGLFHKGIIQSGVYRFEKDVEEDDGSLLVEAILKELGISRNDPEKLQDISYEQLAAAYQKVVPKIQEKGGYTGSFPHVGKDFKGDPILHGFTEHGKKIPVLIGNVLGEFDSGMPPAKKYDLTRQEVKKLLKKRYGKNTERLIPLFEKAYPDKCLADLFSVDTVFRVPAMEFIKKRTESMGSKTYSYQFTYEFPLFGGKTAWHCSEIPFVFHNIDLVPVCGGAEGAEELQDVMSTAWTEFARNGKPVVKGLEWPECTELEEPQMIFDKKCSLTINGDHELIRLISQYENKNMFDRKNAQH